MLIFTLTVNADEDKTVDKRILPYESPMQRKYALLLI